MFEDKSSQLCRLCLKSGACPIDIYDPKRTNGFLVWEIIEELTEIKIYISDGLPPNICENCMKKLTDFKYFKKMCIDSRMEFLFRRMNNGLVVPVTENESGPLREDLCGQGDVHTRDTWNNLEAEGIESEMHVEHEEVAKEMHPLVEYTSTIDGEIYVEEMQSSGVHGSASEVTINEQELMGQEDLCLHLSSSSSDEGSDVEECALNVTGPEAEVTSVNCTDEPNVPVDGDRERVGNLEETLISEKGPNRFAGTGHQRGVGIQCAAFVPVATRSHLKRRRIRQHCRTENYGPDDDIELTPNSTTGELILEENGEHTKIKEKTERESKHSNGALAGNISSGSSVEEEKSEGQDYKCDKCGKVFGSKDLIERHLNVPCGSELRDCGNSNKKFHTRKQYKRHRPILCMSNVSKRRVERGVAVDVSGESEGKRQIKKRNPATCHICKKNFFKRNNLKVHIKTVHLKERKFSCVICGKAFGEKGNLQSHMRCHSGVKPYTCTHCEKGFTESGLLRRHIRAVHEMEKPHTCGECGKAFSRKQNLVQHILSHTGEKPHTCTLCSKTFGHISNLKRHMATHARKVPHPCNHCTKSFAFRSELQRHLAEHRGEEVD